MKNKSVDVLANIKKNGTFVVNPDEETFVTEAATAGLTEEQITRGLSVKRQAVEKQQVQDTEKPVTSKTMPWDQYLSAAEEIAQQSFTPEVRQELKSQYESSIGSVAPDPFKGLTKDEVIRDAFTSGITDVKALKDIADIYDMVMGEQKDDNEDFTTTEQRKLEQAGLLDKSRKEKLDFLYASE